MNRFVCCGVCLLFATGTKAQSPLPLPRNPTIKQVIAYRLQDQHNWELKQLPRNSVLYKVNWMNPVMQSDAMRMQQSNFRIAGLSYPLTSALTADPDGFLLHYLKQERTNYGHWLKNSWWKDPKKGTGAEWIRSMMQ